MSQASRRRPAPPPAWSWGSLLLTTRASWVVLLLGGAGLIVPSQTGDMLAFLGQGRMWGEPTLAFYFALFVLGLNAWYWARAALAAQFGITDQKLRTGSAPSRDGSKPDDLDGWIYDWLPRILFGGGLGIGLVLLLQERRWVFAAVLAASGLAVAFALAMRPGAKDGDRMLPAQEPGTLTLRGLPKGVWHRFKALLQRAPHGFSWSVPVLTISVALFVIGAVQSFVPHTADLGSFLADWLPGPGVAVFLLGLTIGPLTALAFVGDGLPSHFPFRGRNIGLPRFPVLVVLAAWVFWLVPRNFDLHTVRVTEKPSQLFQDGDRFADQRETLVAIFEKWKKACYGEPSPTTVQPIIVAVSGGATRAGLWGAAVLRRIEQEEVQGGPALFAVSSVSGGSLGVAGAMALLSKEPERCHARDALSPLDGNDETVPVPLAGDALAPLLAGWLVNDFPRAFFAPFVEELRRLASSNGHPAQQRGGDSAEAIERAFARLWDKVPNKGNAPGFDEPFLSLFYGKDGKYLSGMPIWLANGTDATTGNRMITAPISSRYKENPTTWPFRSARDVLYLLNLALHVSLRPKFHAVIQKKPSARLWPILAVLAGVGWRSGLVR
jgi:hypothetical protein